MTTLDRVQIIIAALTGELPGAIGWGRPLGNVRLEGKWHDADPLDLDSLDRVDLALKVEDEFGIEIKDDELADQSIGYVGGLVDFIDRKQKEPLELGAPQFAAPLRALVANRREAADRGISGQGAAPATATEAMMTAATDSDRFVRQVLRRAFDAGVRAGRCDPNPAAAWQGFLKSEGLAS